MWPLIDFLCSSTRPHTHIHLGSTNWTRRAIKTTKDSKDKRGHVGLAWSELEEENGDDHISLYLCMNEQNQRKIKYLVLDIKIKELI